MLGLKMWDPHSRLGIYLGHSPYHAGLVALVLNPKTNLMWHFMKIFQLLPISDKALSLPTGPIGYQEFRAGNPWDIWFEQHLISSCWSLPPSLPDSTIPKGKVACWQGIHSFFSARWQGRGHWWWAKWIWCYRGHWRIICDVWLYQSVRALTAPPLQELEKEKENEKASAKPKSHVSKLQQVNLFLFVIYSLVSPFT